MSLLGTFYNYIKNIKSSLLPEISNPKVTFEVAFYLNLSETLQNSGEFEETLSVLLIAKILSLRIYILITE